MDAKQPEEAHGLTLNAPKVGAHAKYQRQRLSCLTLSTNSPLRMDIGKIGHVLAWVVASSSDTLSR